MKNTRYSVRKVVFWGLCVAFLAVLIVAGICEQHHSIKYQYRVVDDFSYQTLKEDQTVIASHTITEEMAGKTVAFHTFDSYVDAEIDSQILYHFGEKPLIGNSPGSYYHFIEIPEDTLGEELSIRIQTVYPHKYADTYQFFVGNTWDLVISFLKKEMLNMITNLFILIFGVIMCSLYIVQRRMDLHGEKNLYFGLMSIVFVLWSNGALFVEQLLFRNAVMQYYLNYFSLFLLLMIVILYIESIDDKIQCKFEFVMAAAAVVICVALHFLGIRDFTETVRLFSILIGIDTVILIIHIIIQQKKYHTIGNTVLVLLVFGVLNVIDYVLRSTRVERYTMFTKIGLIIYVFISGYLGIRDMLNELVLAKESALLKKIAYLDNLTKQKNRYALEHDLKEMELSSLSIVSLDLNNLKTCNDTFGHTMGDRYIKGAADILDSVYQNVYRVGGDEFIALVGTRSKEVLLEKKKEMHKKIAEYNEKENAALFLQIASGYSSYQEGDASYEDILKRADKEMYRDKKQLKEKKKNDRDGEE